MSELVKSTLLGKLIHHLMYIGEKERWLQRERILRSIARIDPTATIGALAGFSNVRGDPENIIVGPGSAVMGEFIVLPGAGRIEIGEKCFVGPGSRIWSAASIIVGDYTLISHDVNIHDNISHPLDLNERHQEIDLVLPHCRPQAHDFDIKASPIIIEDHVWIGFGASVLGGVRIGRGAVIGAATMVTRDVPAFAVAVGNPMRILREGLSETLQGFGS